MKRSLSILIVLIFMSLLSGCILSKTPKTDTIDIQLGKQVTFSVNVFPSNATYTWTLDGTPLMYVFGKSYVYTSTGGNHKLVVKAKQSLGTDTQTWNITCDPIVGLLNSLVSISGGTFMMGSTDNEYSWAKYTTPVHEVTVPSFEIGAYEITQAQYTAIMGINPSYYQEGHGYSGTENYPVENLTWYEAREFCTALSVQTGRTFDLPSEAQWEYACRAGTTTLYSFGDADELLATYGWYYANSNDATHPVGTKLPNPWGLYDMHGNVWEWALDSWHFNYDGAPTDGSAWDPDTGPYRMIRGGSFFSDHAGSCRSAARGVLYPPSYANRGLGFRIVEIP